MQQSKWKLFEFSRQKSTKSLILQHSKWKLFEFSRQKSSKSLILQHSKWRLVEFLRQKSTKKSHFATFQMKIIRIFAPKINKKVSSLCFFPSSVKDYHISANLIGFILIAQLQVSNSQLVKNHQSYDYFGTFLWWWWSLSRNVFVCK